MNQRRSPGPFHLAAGLACAALLAASPLLLAGCEDESTETSDAGADGATEGGADGGTDAATDAGDAAADAAVDAGLPAVITGIIECDDLINAYERCLERKPDLKRADEIMFNVRKTSLRIQAATPEGHEGVLNRCKALFQERYRTNCLL